MNDERTPIIEDLGILLPGVLWNATSLKLPDDLSFEDWNDGVRFLQTCLEYNALERGRLLWYWADMMRFGERMYGERAAQAMELGVATGTLYNVAWIGKVEPSCRHENLPFWTHAPVVRLAPDEQKQWLDQAAEEGWTRKQLTEAIEDRDAENDGQYPDAARARRALRNAADLVARLDVEEWGKAVIEGLVKPLCRAPLREYHREYSWRGSRGRRGLEANGDVAVFLANLAVRLSTLIQETGN